MVPESVLQWTALAQKYAAIRAPLTANEILAIVWSESTGNPNAVNPSDPSYGLMQITLPIAKFYGGITISQQLFDPDRNVSIGSAFLAHLKESYSEHFPTTWVAGYNEGEGNLTRGRPDPSYVAAFDSHMQELAALG
jgi:soluble lytic murein transglycosylase-like protein